MRSRQGVDRRALHLSCGVRPAIPLWAALWVAAVLAVSPGTPNSAMGFQLPSGTGAPSWRVVRGDSTAWKLSSTRLECTVTQPGPHWVISQAPLEGDFVIEANLSPASRKGEGLFLSATPDLSYGYLITIDVATSLYRFSGPELHLITTWPLGHDPSGEDGYAVRIMKKGTSYSVTVDGRVLNTIANPGGNRGAKPQPREPDGGYWGFAFQVKGTHTASNLSARRIASAEFFPNNPIVLIGPKGSWDASVPMPAAVFRHEKMFYLYYAAQDFDAYPAGVGLEPPRRIGIATSSDLKTWKKYEKNPIFGPPFPPREGDTVRFFDFPASTQYATMHGGGGVVRLPDGQYGLTFNVQRDHQWLGVWLAKAASPLGPFEFQKVRPGPILTLGGPDEFDGKTIHLNGALQLSDGTYAMLYTGHNPKFKTPKPPGDRGGLATSKDMIHWTKFAGNPVFEPGEPGSWDDKHARPKTVVKLGAWYYMFYEGAHFNQGGWPEWVDVIGMARSRDLIHWERYPHNPIIPTTTAKQSGDIGQIQPTALVSGDDLYLFYGCLRTGTPMPVAVCGAKIPSNILEKWGAP